MEAHDRHQNADLVDHGEATLAEGQAENPELDAEMLEDEPRPEGPPEDVRREPPHGDPVDPAVGEEPGGS
jgi:hypothetical protein